MLNTDTPGISEAAQCGMRSLRKEAGVSQDEIARVANAHGLPWDRTTVSRLECDGQKPPGRHLTVEAFLLLPLIYTQALGRAVGFGDFISHTRKVRVGNLVAPASTFQGGGLSSERPRAPRGPSEVDRVAAASLSERLGQNVKPVTVMAAALKLWGQPLTDERDEHVEAQLADDPRPASPGRRAAIRGHVTRRLLDDLAPMVRDLHPEGE